MLVTVEGIDGSGKTAVCDALAGRYPGAVMTREPTPSWYGDAVRRSIAMEDADPLAELFLYTADHAAHLADTVRPALAEDCLVICDRFADSRYAYQGATLADRFDDPIEFVRSIHRPWTITPDITIYLDIPASLGVDRSGGATKFEREAYLRQVKDNYERLIAAADGRFRRIDATRPKDAVIDDVMSAVEGALDE